MALDILASPTWFSITPFGIPVEPDVNIIYDKSSGFIHENTLKRLIKKIEN